MTDSAVSAFVQEQRELLDLELESEQEQEKAAISGNQSTSAGEKERSASHILGNLEAADISIGLYGRTVVELSVWNVDAKKSALNDSSATPQAAATSVSAGKDNADHLLPAHRFTVGDEVEIRTKQDRKSSPSGVISAVTDTAVSVALFPQKSHNKKQSGKNGSNATAKKGAVDDDDNDDEAGIGEPPLSLVPKSSVEVHRKLMVALEQLERHGTGHPLCGSVVDACFRVPQHTSTGAPPKQPPVEAFNSNLDPSQIEAIQFALNSDQKISLIHGPPGTGKTTTVAELIRQAVQIHGMKVLVTAPSNVAVDNILERLVASTSTYSSNGDNSKRGGASKRKQKSSISSLRAVRLGHPARIKASILAYSLEALVQSSEGTEIVNDVRKELKSFIRILTNPKSRGTEKRLAYREVKALRKEVRTREEAVVKELISTSQVVLATTVGAGNRILNRLEDGFDLVVIDEAAQALEASCWIPILRGKKVVLAGDHCQLPPTIKSRNRRAQEGLGKTMFQRLMELYQDDKNHATPRISRMLKVQYRMHHQIADWASQAMYGGELSTHESVKNRTLAQLEESKHNSDEDGNVTADIDADLQELSKTPMLLIDTAGCDMHEGVNDAGSRYNEGEANIVEKHVRKLLAIGVKEKELAIITPYNGQVELLRNKLLPEFPQLEIRSVDGFQGGEREAVVLSLVRSSPRGGMNGIGFLKDDRRQNVAITRAKRHVAVVCDSETVSKSKFIKGLISWIEEHGDQKSAIEYLVDSTFDEGYENDIRNAEAEIMKMVAGSLPDATGGKKPSKQGSGKDETIDKEAQESKRRALLDKISAFCDTAKPGESLTLSSELTSFERRLVHEFCEQLDLSHVSEGTDMVNRRLVISKLGKVDNAATHKKSVAPSSQVQAQVHHESSEKVSAVATADIVEQPKSIFANLNIDDDSDSDDEDDTSNSPAQSSNEQSAQNTSAPPDGDNSLLAQLARERQIREKDAALKPAAPKSKKKKKGGQKLGGAKKPAKKAEVQENFDDLDDMAFLDAQIEKSENTHGRKVTGAGKGYRTIINGVLNSKPKPKEAPKNTRAASSLQAKLKEAKDGRHAKGGKKKKG